MNTRPIKRIRRSVPGTSTPKLSSTFVVEDDTPRAPPNTPVRTIRALPEVSILEDKVEVEAEATTSFSAPIPIPQAKQTQEEPESETQDESFDNTQGSSHFSSIMGSFRLGSSLGLGLGMFNASSTSVDRDEEESAADDGWSRWL